MTKRVAIYCRTSTKMQNPEMQLVELRNYSHSRNYNIVVEYVDQASGASSDRENYKKLLNDIRKRKIDIVLTFRFDRIARSTKMLISLLEECQSMGIDFLSYQENIDTSSSAGKVLFTMIAAFAEFEREIIRERVRAGLETAKRKGIVLGRKRISKEKINQIKLLRDKGVPIKEIINQLKISRASYFNIIKTS